jgi:rhodanese-related sulfurtransferase
MARLVPALLLVSSLTVPVVLQAAGMRSPGVEPAELERRLAAPDPPLLIDVRSPTEYSAGHIAGAISIPAPTLDRHLDEIRQAADPVLYCNDTRLTRFSEKLLMRSGVKRFSHLEGGLNAWEATGLPVENSLP